MNKFIIVYWIARKNNLSMFYHNEQKRWYYVSFDDVIKFYEYYDYIIDFYNGKSKILYL